MQVRRGGIKPSFDAERTALSGGLYQPLAEVFLADQLG
jgi:hypothetical protein